MFVDQFAPFRRSKIHPGFAHQEAHSDDAVYGLAPAEVYFSAVVVEILRRITLVHDSGVHIMARHLPGDRGFQWVSLWDSGHCDRHGCCPVGVVVALKFHSFNYLSSAMVALNVEIKQWQVIDNTVLNEGTCLIFFYLL
jgi:hypothetical protein